MKNSLIIYAAGPIDLGLDVADWRQRLMDLLGGSGVQAVLFDPSTAYKQANWGVPDAGRSLYIEQVNRQALELSNIFIACVPKNVPSVGTPIEIEFADKSNSINKSFLITDIQRGKSVYLDNRFSEDNWIFVNDTNSQEDVDAGLCKLSDKLIAGCMTKTEFTDS